VKRKGENPLWMKGESLFCAIKVLTISENEMNKEKSVRILFGDAHGFFFLS